MRRLAATLTTTAVALLLVAPAALADDFGQGTYGDVSDKVTTNAGFMLMAFFPLLCLVLSLVQWRLDKRKERRKASAKKLANDWHGGW